MSLTNKSHDNLTLDHEPSSKIPSKSSQPPITMGKNGLLDLDDRVYYAKKYRQTLSAGPATAIAILAGAPLENVKTRMQSRHFTSAWTATKYTYRTEGLRGFFVGTYAPLVSLTASRAFGFSIYRKAKYSLDKVVEAVTGTSPLQHVNKPGTYPNLYTIGTFFGSGMISGAVVATVLTPIELIKNAAQTSVLMASDASRAPATDPAARKNVGRVSSYGAMRQIVSERGIGGLWTGFRLHLLRDTIGTGIYFGVYETAKQSLNSYYGAEHANSAGAVALAGGICGIVAWGCTYPLDTMKTKAQNRLVGSNSLAAATAGEQIKKEIMSAAGKASTRSSNWTGFEMVVMRSFVQNMIQMSFFEQAKTWIDGLTFTDGSKTLPEVERELGRDSRVRKNPKL